MASLKKTLSLKSPHKHNNAMKTVDAQSVRGMVKVLYKQYSL